MLKFNLFEVIIKSRNINAGNLMQGLSKMHLPMTKKIYTDHRIFKLNPTPEYSLATDLLPPRPQRRNQGAFEYMVIVISSS